MNELEVFENPEFGEIRVIERDGEPWFVAADVCRALDISNPTDALKRLDDDERARFNLGHPMNETNFVNEPGLYSLVLGSRKPEAKTFKRWITHEVIPSIRKHGAYIAGQETMSPEELLAHAVLAANSMIEEMKGKLKSEIALRKEAESNVHMLSIVNRQQQPMVDYFKDCVERNTLTSLRETAKLLHVKEKKMISFLLDNKYLYRSPSGKLLPHGGRPNELFDVKEANDKKRGWFGVQTFVTPRGRETLRLLLAGKPEGALWGMPHTYPRIPAGDVSEMTEGEAHQLETHLKRQARKRGK